jgi:hypothetical protein
MSLAIRIGGFLTVLPKPRFFEFIQIKMEIFGFGKNLIGNLLLVLR